MKMAVIARFDSAVHHGSGMAKGEFIDRAFLRGSDGFPYLAGSALKGKLRHAGRQILTSDQEGERPHAGFRVDFCSGKERCLLCRIFGTPMEAGKATFSDATPSEPHVFGMDARDDRKEPSSGLEVRTTTAVNRWRRVAEPERLYTTEVVASFVEFRFTIEGSLDDEETTFLRHCLQLVTHFGGGASRGLGSVKLVEQGKDAE